VAYSIPRGERRGIDVDLSDMTYDGTNDAGRLSGGLGQLTDGQEGHSNFRLDPFGLGTKGYEWVGWRNESFPDAGAVEILFRFNAVRNFTAVHFHANNMFSKDVRVFRLARLSFNGAGNSGDFPTPLPPVEYVYVRDTAMEYERTVTIPLGFRVGNEVRARLFFDAKWLMISEVRFESGN
jgi:discoidin domain receptor family protein 2